MDDRAPALRIDVEDADGAEARAIAQALAAHVAPFGPRDESALTLVARDSDARLAGGLNGVLHWRWLYIRHFWVEPDQRGTGLGTRLLAAAETLARERDCVGLYLDTFDEGAERFYRRCGFARFGAVPDFPPGHVRRFLRKAL